MHFAVKGNKVKFRIECQSPDFFSTEGTEYLPNGFARVKYLRSTAIRRYIFITDWTLVVQFYYDGCPRF